MKILKYQKWKYKIKSTKWNGHDTLSVPFDANKDYLETSYTQTLIVFVRGTSYKSSKQNVFLDFKISLGHLEELYMKK